MPVGVTSTNSGLTFTDYLQEISETLNHESKGRLLCKQERKWSGSHMEWRLHTSRNTGVGPVEDGGQFPIPGKQGYAAPKAYRRMVAGKIQLTDGIMAAAKKSKNVAKDVMTSEVEGLMRDLLKHDNFFFFRDGTGKAATVMVSGAASATLVEVDDARGLVEGATVQLYSSNGTLEGNLVISSIAPAPDATNYAQVTVAANGLTANATDYLSWNGATSSSSITGLKALIDNTAGVTFQNVVINTYPRYTSLVMGNGAVPRDLTPSLFRQMLAGLKQRGDGQRTVLASNWDAINVEELYEGDQRLSPSDKVAGIALVSFQSFLGRIDVVTDVDMLLGSMFFADFSQIFHGVQKPLEWRKDGSGSIFKRNDESGVYTATALEIGDYFIKERHTSGRLDDLSYTRSTVY